MFHSHSLIVKIIMAALTCSSYKYISVLSRPENCPNISDVVFIELQFCL